MAEVVVAPETRAVDGDLRRQPEPSATASTQAAVELVTADRLAAVAVMAFLYAIYWLTASFSFVSTDELFLFDATESFARRASLLLNQTADLDWPGHAQVEPAQPILSVPLFWIADRLDGVGNVHLTMHFNLLVTAATAALLVFFVRRLNYGRPIAVMAALLYGLTTIAWPYSGNYFREPLGTLTLFLAAYGLLRWRQGLVGGRAWPHRWLALALGAGIVSVFAKESGVVGAPVLMLIPLVDSRWLAWRRKDWLRLVLVLAVAFGLAFAGLYYYTNVLGGATSRFDPLVRVDQAVSNLRLAWLGIGGFLVSPGKSLFLHSPVVVLALAAPWLARRRRADMVLPLLLTTAFVAVYALVRGETWFGGTNWGPRYMVPLTPFLMVGVAPAIERAFRGPRRRLWRVLIGLLALAGLLVQIGAVSVNPLDYYETLAATGIPGAAWTVALWSPYYSAILGHWRALPAGAPNFAWALARPEGPDWALAATWLVVAGLALYFVIRFSRREAGALAALAFTVLCAVAVVSATWFGLRRIYPDQRYQGDNTALHAMREFLQDRGDEDAVVFLNNRAYFNFMMNYYKGSLVWYTLELNPKELVPEGGAPPPPDTDPFSLVNTEAWSRVDYFARQHPLSYLIMEAGPFHPNYVRPLEWWMNSEFHRVREYEFADNVRAVLFSGVSAPGRADPVEFEMQYTLGEQIELTGYDPVPPAGLVRPGDVLNVSTQWRALNDIGQDYIIGTYLITPQGTLALQDDSVAAGGFWPTRYWRADDTIRHNVAFMLPADLPAGHYEVWTLLYSAVDGARLPVADATGTTIRDHVVLYSVEVTR